jgi:hypothetical protein
MCIYKNGRDVMALLLKLNKTKKDKLNYLIRREIKKYKTLDSSEDIEQNIFEGIIKYLFQNKFELQYFDFFTNRIINRNKYRIDNKNLIKSIIAGLYVIKINTNPNDLKFLIEKITSCKYGKNQSNKNDILKISFEKQENYFEEFNDESIYTLGIYDPDSEVDVEMKYFVNKYHNSLSEEEQLIFIKYFYEEVSFSGMIENNFVKNDYVLRNFIKKTKNYFYDQLLDKN